MNTQLSEGALLDFDGWLGGQDEATREGINTHLSVVEEARRPAEKAKLASMFAVSEATGLDIQEVNREWEVVRGGFAEQQGEDWLATKDDDAKFHGKLVEGATKRKDERVLILGPDDPKDTQAQQESLVFKSQEAAYAGKPYADALSDWEASHSHRPGYDPTRASQYATIAAETHKAVSESLTKVRPLADQALAEIVNFRKHDGGEMAPFALLRGLSAEEKNIAFRLMTEGAKPKEGRGIPMEEKGGGQSFLEAVGRGYENLFVGGREAEVHSELTRRKFRAGDLVTESSPMGEALSNILITGDPAAARGRALQKTVSGRALTSEEAAKWNEEREQTLEDIETFEALRKFGQNVADPVARKNEDKWWYQDLFARAVIPIGDSVAIMTTLAIPGGWAPAMRLTANSYQNDAYEQFRAQGMSREEASGMAGLTSMAQAALDKLQVSLLARGIPNVTRTLERFAMSGSTAARLAGNVAGTLAAETGIELTQDFIIPALVQDNLASDPTFDVQWENVWRDVAKAAPDVALGMVLLSGMGGVAQTAQQNTFIREFSSSPSAMRARGYSVEQIEEIQNAPGDQKGALLAQYLPAEAPRGGDQKALVADAVKFSREEQSTFDDLGNAELVLTKEAAQIGVRVVKKGNDWQVTTPEGKVLTVDNVEAARVIREDLKQASSQEEAEALVSIIDSWHSKAGDTERETTLTGETVTADGETVTGTRDGEIVREITDAATLETLREEARMDASDKAIDVLVNGSNTIEFAESVGNAAKQTIQRIELNQSESVALTAIHEQLESSLRLGIAKGSITPRDIQRAFASLRSAFDPNAARTDSERNLRLRISLLAEGRASETELRETVVELAVADIIGRRKDGQVMPAGSVTAALNAQLSNAGDAGSLKGVLKFRAFLKAVRTWFRAVFGTVAALRKAKREGKGQDFEALVNKLLGLEQEEHDAGLADELSEYVPPTPEEEASGIAFSVSAGKRVELVMKRLDAALAKEPERRTTLAKEAKRRLRNLAQSFQAKGERKTPKEINREAAVREAFRREELEAEIYAKHAEVFGNEERGSIWSGPVMSALSKPGTRLHGRIKAKSSAMRSTWFEVNSGDYDGAEGVPQVVFGGDLMPDQAAQELFDDGLIREPSVDALWSAIKQEAEQAKQWKAFLKSAKDELKTAKEQAATEAQEWKAEQTAGQGKEWNSRQRMIRDLQTYNAAISVLPPDIRGKLGGFVTLAQLGDKARLDFIQDRLERANELVEAHLRKEYTKELDKLFERAKPKKDAAGKKRVGKAGADVHALFDTLKRARDFDAQEADAHIAGLEARIASGELTPEEEAHALQEIGLVNLIANWDDADAERMAMAVEEAKRVFADGYADFLLKRANKIERRRARRETLKTETGKAGTATERDAKTIEDNGLKGTWKDSLVGLLNFEQAMKWVFGENSEEAQRIADMERKASNRSVDEQQKTEADIADLFTELAGSARKGTDLSWKLAQKTLKVGERTLSEMEAITATMMWRQEDGRRHMEGSRDDQGKVTSSWSYDQAFIDEIESKLSDEAKAVRDFLTEKYGQEYPTLNAVYRELNGINLPHNPNYSPLTVVPQQAQQGQSIDPLTGSTFSAGSTTPGALRNRSGKVAEPDFRDALQVFIAHNKQMAHWKAYAPMLADAQAILGNRELGNSVEAAAGDQAKKVLRGWLDYFAQGGTRDAGAHLTLNQTIGKMSGRAAAVALVGRIGTLAIQSTQLAAASAEMPTGAYLKRFAQLMTGQLGWGKALDSEYIQRRLRQMPPAARIAIEGLRAEKPNAIKHAVQKMGTLISGADALFTAGTYAMVYDYQLGQAKELGLEGAEAEAFAANAAERSVDRVAQPTRPGARSLFENTASNPFVRLTWAFASEARKNLGLAAYALAKRSPAEKARVLTFVLVLNTVLASMIRNAWRDARDDDDEETLDEKNWSAKRLLLSAMTEPFQGIPVIGSMIEAGVYKAAGEYLPQGNLLSGTDRALAGVMRLDDWKEGDAEQIMKDVDAILSGMGVFNSTIAATASLAHLARDLFGVVDNVTGEPED